MELAYDVTGDGPPLVLVHGLGSSRRCWDLVTDDLSRDFTVFAVDLPGHGETVAMPGLDAVPPTLLAGALSSERPTHTM